MNRLDPPMYPPIGLSERNDEADRLRLIRARKRIAHLEAERDKLRKALLAILLQRPNKYICHEIAQKALAGGEEQQ